MGTQGLFYERIKYERQRSRLLATIEDLLGRPVAPESKESKDGRRGRRLPNRRLDVSRHRWAPVRRHALGLRPATPAWVAVGCWQL